MLGLQQMFIYTMYQCSASVPLNTLRPRQLGTISQTTFSNAFSWMKMFELRLRFHWSLILMIQLTALIQIMAWRRSGDKPLSEPMMVRLLTHICIARPQWVKYFYNSNTFMLSIFYNRFTWIQYYILSLRFRFNRHIIFIPLHGGAELDLIWRLELIGHGQHPYSWKWLGWSYITGRYAVLERYWCKSLFWQRSSRSNWAFNSLSPRRCGSNSKSMIGELIQNSSLGTHCEIELRASIH